MRNIKLLSLGFATFGLLVGGIAVGPNKVSAFVRRIIFGERSKVIQEMEELNAQGKGTILEQGKGYTVKKFQLKDGKEGIMYKATGEAKGEYNYKDPEGKWEIKAGPSVKAELEEIENREGVKRYEVGR